MISTKKPFPLKENGFNLVSFCKNPATGKQVDKLLYINLIFRQEIQNDKLIFGETNDCSCIANIREIIMQSAFGSSFFSDLLSRNAYVLKLC